jgi:SAM-dependent methyltransferase
MYGDPDKYFEHHGSFEAKAERSRATIREIKRRTGMADPSILDVGSGRGEMLAAAQLEGITTAVGLELSSAMIEYASAHRLTVHHQTAEQYAGTGQRFDALVLAAVAEHVENPDALMTAASRLASPGAVLLIDVPREPNILTMAGKVIATARRSPGVLNLSPTFRPFHVYGFNPKSLSALLVKHHFQIEQLSVRAAPKVSHRTDLRDSLVALGGGMLIHLGNLTRTAPNMTGWARRVE